MKHSPLDISFLIELAPVGLSHEACLCTDPAQVSSVASIIPDQDARLEFTSHCKGLLPLIICLGVDISGFICSSIISCSSLSSVEPCLEDRAIIRQKFPQLVTEILHIRRCAIFRMISVPWREIHAEFQSIFPAGIGQFSDHITLAIFPRSILHGILGILRRPHTESAMMLCREDDTFHTCFLAYARPLTAVKAVWVEKFQRLVTIPPRLICISVEGIMDECIILHLLPAHLIL